MNTVLQKIDFSASSFYRDHPSAWEFSDFFPQKIEFGDQTVLRKRFGDYRERKKHIEFFDELEWIVANKKMFLNEINFIPALQQKFLNREVLLKLGNFSRFWFFQFFRNFRSREVFFGNQRDSFRSDWIRSLWAPSWARKIFWSRKSQLDRMSHT